MEENLKKPLSKEEIEKIAEREKERLMRLEENLERIDNTILSLRDAYELLIKIYKKYIYLEEKYYPVVACWILGNFFHKMFPTFPYLFLNASKGSGKSRFLKLSAFLVNGVYTVNITEAVLFRENVPLFIDEIERITKKEMSGLRELLNVAYKRGGVVKRVRRIERTGQEIVQNFEVYRPVAMANITGIDDVLEDRCITIVLEKCFDPTITRRLELFELDSDIIRFKNFATTQLLTSEGSEGSVSEGWRESIGRVIVALFYYYNQTLPSLLTLPTLSNNPTQPSLPTQIITYENIDKVEQLLDDPIISNLIKKIDQTDLQGRDLELFLPLFIIATELGDDILDSLISFAVEYSQKRKETNIVENRDVMFIGFFAGYCKAYEINDSQFVAIKELVKEFKRLNEDEDWFTPEWVGRALKRMGKLVIEKRRTSKGTEVRVDVNYLFERAKKFGINFEQIACELKGVEMSNLEIYGGGNV